MGEDHKAQNARPQTPQGEQKGLVTDLLIGAGGNAAYDVAKVIGGAALGHLKPKSSQVDDPPAWVNGGHGGTNTGSDPEGS